MVLALAQINSRVETDAGLNRDYQKLFLVTFDFALDLGFNILPEHLSLFSSVVFFSPGLRVLAFRFLFFRGFY